MNAKDAMWTLCTLYPRMFPFDLVHEVEIGLVELMHPYVSILTATTITGVQRVNSDGIQWAKVPSHSPDLLFENFMEEAGFELSLPRGGSGDIHGSLATAEYNKVLSRCDGGTVERGVGRI